MSLHMMAKDVDIFGMYLVVNGNETKYALQTVTFQICQLNDDLYCIVNFIRPSTFNIIINYNANISNGHNREMKSFKIKHIHQNNQQKTRTT